MISGLVKSITRYEGQKFLKLRPGIDETTVFRTEVDEGISLYIHIPFCRTLYPFCCFNRYLFREGEAREYFKSLRKEIDLYIQRGFRFSEFYFGGGTPTVLMDELTGFINYLRSNFKVQRISLETTPREINEENIALLQAAGVNRLSVGVQSFDDGILKTMGRLFINGEEVKRRLLMVQGKFDTVNVDIVFNFPGQSTAQFKADIQTFKNLNIDQATFYPLMPSPHKKDALERRFNRVDTSQEKRLYDIIMDEVYASGYRASTVWCFSKGDRMIDEYIIESDDYIGIGSGSVSMFKGTFYVNSFSLDRYRVLLENGKLPVVGSRKLSPAEYRRYYLLTKLFSLTLDKTKFHRRFDADIDRSLGKELLFLKLAGVVKGKSIIKVTPKGMYPVSVMMREFFASLNGLREYCIENRV